MKRQRVDDTPYKCEVCAAGFGSQQAMNSHRTKKGCAVRAGEEADAVLCSQANCTVLMPACSVAMHLSAVHGIHGTGALPTASSQADVQQQHMHDYHDDPPDTSHQHDDGDRHHDPSSDDENLPLEEQASGMDSLDGDIFDGIAEEEQPGQQSEQQPPGPQRQEMPVDQQQPQKAPPQQNQQQMQQPVVAEDSRVRFYSAARIQQLASGFNLSQAQTNHLLKTLHDPDMDLSQLPQNADALHRHSEEYCNMFVGAAPTLWRHKLVDNAFNLRTLGYKKTLYLFTVDVRAALLLALRSYEPADLTLQGEELHDVNGER